MPSLPTLVIGNKNYSSWSLRPWLLLRQSGTPFEEVRIPLFQPGSAERLREWSPTEKVPVLRHGGLTIWDSLAIAEYVSEQFLSGSGWPRDPGDRALARAMSAEMHTGFAQLRGQWPMNCRLRRRLEPDAALAREIARVDALWSHCLERAAGGDWLFGEFCIADSMFAPVALRFWSYQPSLSPRGQAYVEHIVANAHIQEWMAAGRAEREVIADDEVGYLRGEAGWGREEHLSGLLVPQP